MIAPKNLAELVEKYLAGSASQEEIHLLNRWYHSFDDTESQVLISEQIDEQLLAERIKSRLDKTINKEKVAPVISIQNRWKQVTAVAAVFLIVTIGFLLFSSNDSAPADSNSIANKAETATDDIMPGGNKAVLTLSDGSVIILDSADNGLLSTQGNIKIEKLDNGLLAYRVNNQLITENDEAFYNTISTPRGGQYHITLADGTEVWLNAASSIRFPVVFKGHERRVTVTGETYFEVAKNAKMPFKVTASNAEVEVLGTHFNINAYDDEEAIKTTLLEGKVKVSTASSVAVADYLSPGQQSAITKSGKITVSENADLEEVMAWKNGRFQFKSTDLKSILRQISRWYDVDVIYKSNLDLHFTGQLTRNDNVSKVFEMLQLTGEVKFKVEGKKIIVSAK